MARGIPIRGPGHETPGKKRPAHLASPQQDRASYAGDWGLGRRVLDLWPFPNLSSLWRPIMRPNLVGLLATVILLSATSAFGGSSVQVVAKVKMLSRTGGIPQATLLTPSARSMYRVSLYSEALSSTGFTSWTLTFTWSDDIGQHNYTCYVPTEGISQCSFLLDANAGTAIDY